MRVLDLLLFIALSHWWLRSGFICPTELNSFSAGLAKLYIVSLQKVKVSEQTCFRLFHSVLLIAK